MGFTYGLHSTKNGQRFYKKDGTLGFNVDDLKELLTFYKTLIDNKIVPTTLHKDANDLSDNKSIAGFSWTSDATKIQGLMEKSNKEAGVGKIHSIDGKTRLDM